MKIYVNDPPLVVRLQISRQLEQTYYLTLCETTRKEVINFCKKLIEKQKISPFVRGYSTSINVRDAKGKENLKSESISFKGLSTEQTYNLIMDAIKN